MHGEGLCEKKKGAGGDQFGVLLRVGMRGRLRERDIKQVGVSGKTQGKRDSLLVSKGVVIKSEREGEKEGRRRELSKLIL